MGVEVFTAHGGRAQGRRRCDDAAIAARAHGRRWYPRCANISATMVSTRPSSLGKGRCAGHASRTDEPRRRDRLRYRRRTAERDRGAGRDGGRGANGGDRGAAADGRKNWPDDGADPSTRMPASSIPRAIWTRPAISSSSTAKLQPAAQAPPGRARRRRDEDCNGLTPSSRAGRHARASSANRVRSTAKPSPRPARRRRQGGVTSLIMMPDTDPVIDDVALVEFVQRTGARRPP
jgi:hypothetical protein